MTELYDAYYYATGCGQPYERNESWLRFFGGIADRIVSEIGPATVLDAGCALGFLVETLRERGVGPSAWISPSSPSPTFIQPSSPSAGSVRWPIPFPRDTI